MCKIELSKEHDMAQFWPSCSRGGLILQTIFKLICNIKYSTRPAIAQWESALVVCGKILSIPAIFLLFGKSLKCLYLSKISTDLYSVKKTPKCHNFATVIKHSPHF